MDWRGSIRYYDCDVDDKHVWREGTDLAAKAKGEMLLHCHLFATSGKLDLLAR